MAVVEKMNPKKSGKDTIGEAGPGPVGQDSVTAFRRAFEAGEYPYEEKMSRDAYEAEKAQLQAELLKVQIWAQEAEQKFVLLFEGRDAAGKGGTIKRFTEHLNPRQARVVALNKPTWEEMGQWYFQLYINELPTVARWCSMTGPGTTGPGWSA